MRKKRRFQTPPLVGGSALLVMCTVLCLTVFALLSLLTARANACVADAEAQAVADYYAADTQAETVFARLRAGETPTAPEIDTYTDPQDGGAHYSFTLPIDQDQTLYVHLREQDGQWSVLCWQARTVGDWSPDTSLPVWDGEA